MRTLIIKKLQIKKDNFCSNGTEHHNSCKKIWLFFYCLKWKEEFNVYSISNKQGKKYGFT